MLINASYMQLFAEKHNLPAEGRVELHGTGDDLFLTIQHPVVLARFVSFVRARCAESGATVFLRGQPENYSGMVPSLFRDARDSSDKDQRWRAYLWVLENLPLKFELGRFRRTNLGALLQHYGLRTPWIDCVDNMYVAIWFARHVAATSDGTVVYTRRNRGTGWIYLLSSKTLNRQDLHQVDLRTHHSSLSVRPHVQHGCSVARQEDAATLRNGSNLIRYLVGRVRFDLRPCWFMSGQFSAVNYMFAKPEFDHTARVLQTPTANQFLREAEQRHGLPEGAIGHFGDVEARSPMRLNRNSQPKRNQRR